MRIALLHPTFWPEVRRGSERLIHDLGTELVARGHEVTLLTSHPGSPVTRIEDGIRVVRSWRVPQRGPLRWYEHHIGNSPNIPWQLLRGDFDLAHTFFPVDAWAAVHTHCLGGPPVVFSLHGIPTRAHLVKGRYRLEMTERAISEASAVSALSDAAADAVERFFGRRPEVLPGGVRLSAFTVDAERSNTPTLICAASLGDPRKRTELLFSAFERLRQDRPDVRLLLTRPRDPVLSGAVPALPDGAEWIDGDRTEALARAYAQSWASVLPAVEEAFGLVLVESLAAGTPVVAARSGSCPEVLTDLRHGRLFEPDDEASLTAALHDVLELSHDPGVRTACRARGADFDWAKVVERYEVVYSRVRSPE